MRDILNIEATKATGGKNLEKAKTSKNTPDRLQSLIQQYTPQNSARILDIPCGTGVLANRLQSCSQTYQVHAADIRNICKAENVSFQQLDMNAPLPFTDGYFDAVVCGDGLAHLRRPFDFVQECHRVLKDQGFLYLSTPNLSSLRSRWRFFSTGFHNKRKMPFDESNTHPEHIINALDFPDLRYLLHSNGFRIMEIRSNRYKVFSLLYAIFLPFVFISTLHAFIKESLQRNRTPQELRLFKEVFKQMFCCEVLFGETLILGVKKT